MLQTNYLFKDVFPTLQTFDSAMALPFETPLSTSINTFTYNFLYSKFFNSTIAYDTKEAFIEHFKLTYMEFTPSFARKFEAYMNASGLTQDAFKQTDITIESSAINPTLPFTNPVQQLADYSNEQRASSGTLSPMSLLNSIMDEFPEDIISDYVDKFKVHFIWAYGNHFYLYED